MADLQRKAVIVTRRTRLQELVARHNTVAQARFYVEHLGTDFSDIEREDLTYARALASVQASVRQYCRLQTVERSLLPSVLFGSDDVVIALGQDGVVANTLKYLRGQPLLGVNPDPQRFEGLLLPFESRDLGKVFPEVLAGRRPTRSVTMAKAQLSDGQVLYAVNDLFVGPKSHVSARYELALGEAREVQSSSGIIVSTGLGSTAWLKSIVTGAAAVAAYSSGQRSPSEPYRPLPWDAPYLQFIVREPFPSIGNAAGLVSGRTDRSRPLCIRSLMPEHGVIFSDGIESDFLEFNTGALATISTAEQVGYLVH